MEKYCICPDKIPANLYRADFQEAPPARSILRLGFSASDAETSHPDSMPSFGDAFFKHFDTQRVPIANSTSLYAQGDIVPTSKFISTWTTREAAEEEIRRMSVVPGNKVAPTTTTTNGEVKTEETDIGLAREELQGSWNVSKFSSIWFLTRTNSLLSSSLFQIDLCRLSIVNFEILRYTQYLETG